MVPRGFNFPENAGGIKLAISDVFNDDGAGFVLLPSGIKFPPQEKEWQTRGHSFKEASYHPGNRGILAGSGYIGLDQDSPEAFERMGLPDTTTWETRPGRLGMRYKCADVEFALQKHGFKPNQAQIFIYDPNKIVGEDARGNSIFDHVGEIKLQRTYQVIPPSWKEVDGNTVYYKILKNISPSEISLDKLLTDLKTEGLIFSKTAKENLELNAARLENMGRTAKKAKYPKEEKRFENYAKAALEAECSEVASTPEGSRNDRLNKASFAMGQLIGADVLDESDAVRSLIRAGQTAGLDLEEIERTIQSGIDGGKASPRELPEDTPLRLPAAQPPTDVIKTETQAAHEEDETKEPEIQYNPILEVKLEKSNFVSKYIDYAKETSDAYMEYHYASSLVLLSVATDRKVVVSMRHGDIYPNIWIFPLGDSTISRKTTAFKLCHLILKNVYPRNGLPSSFSPEALIEAIAMIPRAYYLKDEAGSLLASMCKDYMSETRDFFAEIYECGSYYRKTKKQESYIVDPYITQYLMTTPDNLKEYTTKLDITSGWLLRYLWMAPNYPKAWKPYVQKTKDDFDKYAAIESAYREIVARVGSNNRNLIMSTEAMVFYQGWQKKIEKEAMEEQSNITKAIAGRLMIYAIKMAALFTIGKIDYNQESQISLEHIKEAARQVEEYFLPIGKIIVEDIERSEAKNIQDKIIGTIKRSGGKIFHRDLLRALHIKMSDVQDSIEALIESEEIGRKTAKSGKVCYFLKRESSVVISSIVSQELVYKEDKMEPDKECNSIIVSHTPIYKVDNQYIKKDSSLYSANIDTKLVGPSDIPTEANLDEVKSSKIDRETPVSDDTRIKLAARLEYGINVRVDARIVAGKLKLPVEQVVAWLEANYEKIDGVVYTQRRA